MLASTSPEVKDHGLRVGGLVLPTLATIAETMAVLRCSRSHVYRLIDRGDLKRVNITAGQVFIDGASLRDLLVERGVTA